MNKKLLVLALVPVLVVMSGALAFSAFSGTITTDVTASAGQLNYYEKVTSNYTYEDNTAVTNSSSVSDSTVTLTVSNLAPGNWIVFNITVYNEGVGMMLTGTTNITAITPSDLGSNAVNAVTPSDASSTFMYGSELTGVGYYYAVTGVPSGSINTDGSHIYSVYVGLGSNSDSSYEGSVFTLTVTITVSSDP